GDEDQLGASYPIIDKVIITLIQQGFNPDGSWSQLDNLPGVDDVSDEVVKKLAMRALQGAYKRKGTITLSRQELGLPSIKNIPIKKQVAIYGGSFNPPSKHHCRIVEELEKQFDLVIIYPCGNRPDKPSANIVSIEHRKEMMKLAFGGMPNTRLDLHDLENDTFTPTYDLQERIQGQFENAEIWHFVGSDLIVGGRDSNSEIQRVWHHGQILWQYFNFAINIRPGYEIAEDDMPPNSKLIEIKDLVGSGTMIRERIKNGAPIQDFVLPEVEGYIRKYGLYSKN
ncbi:nicotinate-nicotinamide nucleotide adenylyltransferase, partial [Patescibacteria group bacterium]|nr:nicotinate-nicotinamide nucleotide adenylyltransferase [Patescibacteria group bacterium]